MIISSILDTDFYKFTMQQAVWKLFPEVQARYELIFRTPVKFPKGFFGSFREELRLIDKYLKGSKEDANILRSAGRNYWRIHNGKDTYNPGSYFSEDYLEMFKNYAFDGEYLDILMDNDELHITIEGPWWKTILWEVPLMALISELYYLESLGSLRVKEIEEVPRNRNKARLFEELYPHVELFEFGTRRRFSKNYQLRVIQDFNDVAVNAFRGSSNVEMFSWGGIRPIGTNAHEWYMFHAVKYGYKAANFFALINWLQVYQGHSELMTGLTDTFTTEGFLKNNPLIPDFFPVLRHDSGNPMDFIHKVLPLARKYSQPHKKLKIIFSDSLNFSKVEAIHNYIREFGYQDMIDVAYGIGTNLTNDVPGVEPLNMVIKLTGVKLNENQREWSPTIKLSDTEGKTLGPEEEIEKCRKELKLC